ncbi:MAG: GGDEF domain-containing protein [Candidatus Aminicenantes bacterium]|nr:GGDEF domain-containing protein [Candidatus Aminicenantes bacterium]
MLSSEVIWIIIGGLLLLVLVVFLLYMKTYVLREQKSKLEDLVAKRTVELEAANAQLETLVRNDPLTGVTNRRGFDEKFEEEWRRASRYGAFISILMIDVDYFKNYNDTLGHQEGDRALKMIAKALAKLFKRAGEIVARYGGEEFVILMPGVTPGETIEAAERARLQIEDLKLSHPSSDTAAVVTVSIGYSIGFPKETNSTTELISAADKALYKAKLNGRNRVEGERNLE